MTSIQQSREARKGFWGWVSGTEDPQGCWIWQGARDKDGYGYAHHEGRLQKAHRVAYQIWHGPIPKGKSVCHDCPAGDNPSCVNPIHLWVGTNAENMADKVAKGRTAIGERFKSAKLSDELVRELRNLRTEGYTQRALARRYRCSRNAIRLALAGKTWKHVK